jgi:hypothetical protein
MLSQIALCVSVKNLRSSSGAYATKITIQKIMSDKNALNIPK